MQLSCIEYLKNQPSWILLLSSVGLISLLKNLTSLLKWIYVTFLRPPQNLKNFGSWALITGPTDGIGKAFAFQLAQRGLNLILVARNYDKLRAVSSAIQDKFPKTQIRFVTVDFSSDLAIEIRRIEEAIEGIDIGVLINNVGITYPAARFFHEVEEEVWMKLIKVNIEGTTRVTRAVLPGMIRRKRGAIVNIGSGSSIVVPSHPLYAIYAATKGYVDQLSRCLYVEYQQSGIAVQCQVPLYVSTKLISKMFETDDPSLFVPSADAYARAAVRRIGYEARCMPHWAHSIQWCLALVLPDAVLNEWRLWIGLRRRSNSNSEK